MVTVCVRNRRGGIIARKFDMKDGPELVLDTDYESIPIPVPDGVGNKLRPIVKPAASD